MCIRDSPKVTYCDPEIASVGLTEAAARAEHGEVRAYEYNLGGNGKSQILGTSGFVSVVRVVDGPVVGIHMIGARTVSYTHLDVYKRQPQSNVTVVQR